MDDLLARLQAHDECAIRQLRRQMFPAVKSLCVHIVREPGLAREIAEDLWTDFLLDYVHGIRHAEAIPAYLRLMAVRRSRAVQERLARHQGPPSDEEPDLAENAESRMLARAQQHEQQAHLARCLEGLSERARRMLRLRYHHDMTQQAIGEAFGTSKQYVSRILAKSLDALRRCLEASA